MSSTEDLHHLKVGESRHVQLVPNPALQTDPQHPVFRMSFRSNIFYYTHDMWLNARTVLFESLLEPHPTTLYYKNCVFRAAFDSEFSGCDVTMLVPPGDAVWSMQSCLSHNKRMLILPRETSIERLDLTTLKRDVLFQLPVAEQNYGISGLTLTCDDAMLYFVTWHHDAALTPNGRVYRINMKSLQTECITDVLFPSVWTHFLASPTDPALISYACIEEVRYPQFHEADNRIRLLHLDQTKPGSAMSSILYNNKRNGPPWAREIVTHECWGKDGQYLTFIVRRDKIKRVNVYLKSSEIVFKGGSRGPKPWHCDGANGKYFVFDTMNPNTGVWVGQFGEKGAKKICHAANVTSWVQPHHPHPLFSPDLSHVLFNSIDGYEGYVHVVRR